jgi:hypothetical protein
MTYGDKQKEREASRERTRKWQAKPSSKAHVRDKTYRAKYGIGIKEYDEMFESQNGTCFLCPSLAGDNGILKELKRLFIDHNHVTGKVRKLLCSNCNFGLGLFNDDPVLLRKAAAYLRKDT